MMNSASPALKFVLLFTAALLALAPVQAAVALSVEKEVKLGQEEHQKIVGNYGIYRNSELQSYVTRVGQRIAAEASRQDIEYIFTVLDDDSINAFALPGGFVYITRGLLTHMNSESQLAAVLGHEIAHVTEKHAIKRMNRQKGAEFVNQVLAVVTQQAAVYELGSLFGGVLIRGYSRERELEADEVGAEYMARAGYSPSAMLETIEILKAKDRLEIAQARLEDREATVYHGFLSTHPDHDTRYKQAIEKSALLVSEQGEFVQSDEFLKKLNGLTWGPSRQLGVIRGNQYYYPRLGIKFSFPDDWRTESAPDQLRVTSQKGDAAFVVNHARLMGKMTLEELAKRVVGNDIREAREITIANLPTLLGVANRAESLYGPRPVRFAVILDERRLSVYVLRGAGKHDLRKIASDRDFIATIFSFDRMDNSDYRDATGLRVQVVRAEEDTTMEQLAEESPITNYPLDKLRAINGLYPDGQPEPGQLIKVIM